MRCAKPVKQRAHHVYSRSWRIPYCTRAARLVALHTSQAKAHQGDPTRSFRGLRSRHNNHHELETNDSENTSQNRVLKMFTTTTKCDTAYQPRPKNNNGNCTQRPYTTLWFGKPTCTTPPSAVGKTRTQLNGPLRNGIKRRKNSFDSSLVVIIPSLSCEGRIDYG